MSPTAHLAAINIFTGDIQGGLGPFLATWLAQDGHWSPGRIGVVTTIVGLATLLLNAPAGALVDYAGRPRLLLAGACGAILGGTLLLLGTTSFVGVLLAQFLAACGGILVVPALTSLTLGIVGKQAFPRQQGRNQAFNHAGIVAAALAIGAGARLLGASAAFFVLAGMAMAAIIAVATTPSAAWNGRRAHGWKEDEPDDKKHSHPLRALLANRRLMLLAAVLAMFNLANGTMLSLIGQRAGRVRHQRQRMGGHLRHRRATDDGSSGALGRLPGRQARAPPPPGGRVRGAASARGTVGADHRALVPGREWRCWTA